jgi:hypothetical protein
MTSMDNASNQADQLKQAIQDDIVDSEKRLQTIKLWSDVAPHIQSRKTELQSLLDILNGLPQDILDELAPALLQIQRESRTRFEFSMPPIYAPDPNKTIIYSSSGTSSAYATMIISALDINPHPEWATKALTKLHELAQDRARRAELPAKLANIDSDLPTTFAAALDSYDKAKSRIVGLDSSVMRMRDLIEHVWRGLTSKAQANCQDIRNHLELKKPAHRQEVAQCLAQDTKAAHLLQHLEELHQLFSDMSKPGKDPSFDNSQLADEYFTRLILQLDSLFIWIAI